IELGPAAGAKGGNVIAEGPPDQLERDPRSIMGPFLAGAPAVPADRAAREGTGGQITIHIGDLYNLHDVTADFPVGRLTAPAGPSRSTRRRSVRTRAQRRRPTVERSTTSAACSPTPGTRGGGAGRPVTSRSTPARASARPAVGLGTSTSTSSTCPT